MFCLVCLHSTHQIVNDVKPFFEGKRSNLHTKRLQKLLLLSCHMKDLLLFSFPLKRGESENSWSHLADADPFNVTSRIHMLLDVTTDERQNQANGVRARSGTEAYMGSFGTVTQYTVCRTGQEAGATPTHVLRERWQKSLFAPEWQFTSALSTDM